LHVSVELVGVSTTTTASDANRPSVTFAADVVAAAVYVNVSRLAATGPNPLTTPPVDWLGAKNELRA